MKAVASLELGQTGEILERLRKQGIPAKIQTVTEESGLEMSEILVEDSDYDRGCDVVEAWQEDQLAARRRGDSVYCRKCGSRNYDRTWDERIGFVCRCRDCGDEFGL
jgi:Rieske Fe-S protein